MARIRTIKPEFWTSEQIAECSPNARLMFIGLWNFCDDYGVHPASEMRLKLQVFPGDAFTKIDVRGFIDELIDTGLLTEYEVNGETYWHVTSWEKHQRMESPTGKYPLPNGKIGQTVRGNRKDKGYKRSKSDQKDLRESLTNDSKPFDEHSSNVSRTSAEHSEKVNPKEKEKEKDKEKEISLSGDNAPAQPEKKSKTNEYPEQFSKFWEFAKSHYTRVANPVGNKLEAFEQFKKLKPTDSECQDWLRALLAQVNAKQAITQQGGSPTQLKHLSRWLKNRGWEDTPDPVPILPPRPGQPAALNPGARKREFMAGGVS